MHYTNTYTFMYIHVYAYINTYATACAAIHKSRIGALFFTFCALYFLFNSIVNVCGRARDFRDPIKGVTK